MKIKFIWTDDKQFLKMRPKLGIEWDDLPAMAIDTDKVGKQMSIYPKTLPFSKENIIGWLKNSFKDYEDTDYVSSAVQVNYDRSLEKYFLDKLKPATR